MYRVAFSGNDFDNYDLDKRRYFLHLPVSVTDLAAIPGGPKTGMRVIIYETGEMEMEAELEFSQEWDCWMARAFDDTIVYYPESLPPSFT
ncbi:hypothetical protein [Microvirga terricola]|uniref:Uncharacterized protein n=1 Tax=Microvirga terricola TaxID=2719797 RepID=A0ABX0VGI6_9HYPH|nr:hypothetical protein [Microvirga terricola]NIX77596.1 hypothetical protein [Microvirga terricola]